MTYEFGHMILVLITELSMTYEFRNMIWVLLILVKYFGSVNDLRVLTYDLGTLNTCQIFRNSQ